MCKKIISFLFVFATVFLLTVVPSYAAVFDTSYLLQDLTAVQAWNLWIDANASAELAGNNGSALVWTEADMCMASAGVGAAASYADFQYAAVRWNGRLKSVGQYFAQVMYAAFFGAYTPEAEVAYDNDLGVYRLREKHTLLWLVNSSGHFPYYRPETSGTVDPIGQWILKENIKSNSALWHTVIGADLSAYMETWPDKNCVIEDCGDYFWIAWTDTSSRLSKRYVLCDEYGYPYYVPKPKQTAVTTPNNYYTEQGDTLNVYDQGTAILDSILDVENGILNVGGEAYYVDEINYDDSTKTYYVDSHDSYTWNTTTNNYITNNYKWEITYNIDYTSVTYIGQTAEYEEEYKYYYELPDGRSSADLTREDLEQLSVVFYDVMNYSRTTDNDKMRALYHFDGNTEDSSYWSYTRHGFTWLKGASLTYMDEGVFNGSLYLDETEHQFEIELPGQDAASEWTLQFRYYQSYTATPQKDSYLSIGGDPLLYFTGSQYLDKNGAVICDTSVGTWNEICLVRTSDGSLLYFINGVYYKTVSDRYHSPVIAFYFGSGQQTYKKIDELRFSKLSLYTSSGYSPSSVPYDSNLALVLPDEATYVADEIVTYKQANLGSSNFISSPTYYPFSSVESLMSAPFLQKFYWDSSIWLYDQFDLYKDGSCELVYNEKYSSFSQGENGGIVYTPSVSSPVVISDTGDYKDGVRALGNGFFVPLYASDSLSKSPNDVKCFESGWWGFTVGVVLADGSTSYYTWYADRFRVQSDRNNSEVVIEWGTIGGAYYWIGDEQWYNQYFHGLHIYPKDGQPVEILDIFINGGQYYPSVSIETVLYDADELTEDPILAVRSNRPISSYQIGGVRPSYPEKGQVYAMVENNRIVSLQQYTGALWEAVDGRIWTGSRWIPYSSFDVKTLQDFWDVEGTSGDDYIYSESGFWSWFQKQWKVFMGKMDQIIYYLSESVGLPIEPDCEHVYTGVETLPTCSNPGGVVYTCKECGHEVLESVPALGHDWIVIEDIPSEFELPEDAHCPSCENKDFSYELNSSQDEFTCSCSVCDREWKETPITTWGHTISECSRCGVRQTESKDPHGNGIFTAVGNFLSDGIDWILDKLTQAVEAVTGIQDTFKSFADRMKENVGQYPAFLAAAIDVLPDDFMDVVWFSVIALVAVLVFKQIIG